MNIDTNPDSYGRRGQRWAPEFIKYMKFIITHPTYSNMPDAVINGWKMQWEAPSNRSPGTYQFTYQNQKKMVGAQSCDCWHRCYS